MIDNEREAVCAKGKMEVYGLRREVNGRIKEQITSSTDEKEALEMKWQEKSREREEEGRNGE